MAWSIFSSYCSNRCRPAGVVISASNSLRRHMLEWLTPGLDLWFTSLYSHCLQPTVNPCSTKSPYVILNALGNGSSVLLRASSRSPSWKRTSSSGFSRCDHGVADSAESLLKLQRFSSGRLCKDLAVVTPSAVATMYALDERL